MNYLELCQRVKQKSDFSGTFTTVSGATGDNAVIADVVRTADRLVQSQWSNWKFLWRQVDPYTTVAGNRFLIPPADLNTWDMESFKVDGVPFFEVAMYQAVRRDFDDPDMRGGPVRIVVMPNNQLRLDPPPDSGGYQITADYYVNPTMLTNDGDVPAIPEFYHEAIVGRALIELGVDQSSEDLIGRGRLIYDPWIEKLEANQLPTTFNAGAQNAGAFVQIQAE